jgi:hypothetical protein
VRPELTSWKTRFAICAQGGSARWFGHFFTPFSTATRSTFYPDRTEPPHHTPLVRGDGWMRGVELVARRIVELRFGERFPELEVDYRGPDVLEHYTLRTGDWGTRTPEDDLPSQEAALEAFAVWAAAEGVPMRRGWLDVPVVVPERVDAPIRDELREAPAGYRTSAKVTEWTWTAPMTSQERLLRWVLGRNRRSWPFVAEAAVHEDTLFFKDRLEDAHAWALPLGSVRTRWDVGSSDRIYVFGRHTQVGFFGRERLCPVRAILEQRLEARA